MIKDPYIEQVRAHVDGGGKIGEPAAHSLLKICEELTDEIKRRNALEHTAPDGSTRKSHYLLNDRGEQAIDTIYRVGWGPEFCAGNVLKYLRRNKDEAHSKESARRYYEWLLALAVKQRETGQGRAIEVLETLISEFTYDETEVMR